MTAGASPEGAFVPAGRVYLLRHGDTGSAGRYTGSLDPDLSDLGRKQARALARPLAALGRARFLTSPLLRARRTAELAAPPGVLVEEREELREIDFGSWEGLTFAEIERKDPENARRWANFSDDFEFPGGESIRDFLARLRKIPELLEAGANENAPRDTAIFTHGGVIRMLICVLSGLEARRYIEFAPRHASLTVFAFEEGTPREYRRETIDDCAHLERSGI